MTVRVRFAPSPTGYLHIGAARTALFNWLFARKTGGRFLLRIEDTDIQRSTETATRSILEGLTWLGLDHDEAVVFQSENADKHRAAAQSLLAEGKAYRDFTPKEEHSDLNIKKEIAERARALSVEGDTQHHRQNPYRHLSQEESDRRAAAGEAFAIRLKVSEARGEYSVFEDIVFGRQRREYSEIEDLVLIRSDGHPLYNLSVVVDDIMMGITHVIRGQDHLTNTHKQALIYHALGAALPRFAHLPLILAPSKTKLSKRKHGAVVSLTTYRDRGFLAEAFRNFLLLLGWSSGDDKEILTLDEMIERFSLEGIGRANAIFNFSESDERNWTDQKAIWMNAEYIRSLPIKRLLPFVKAEMESVSIWDPRYENEERDWFINTIQIIRQRFYTLKDFTGQGRAFFDDAFRFDEAAVAKNILKSPQLKELLPELALRLDTTEPFKAANVESTLRALADEVGVKAALLINGARTALTGQAVGPSMFEVFEIMGRKRSVKRLKDSTKLFVHLEENTNV